MSGDLDWYERIEETTGALPPRFLSARAMKALPEYTQTMPTMSPDTWPPGRSWRRNAAEPKMLALFQGGAETQERMDWARHFPIWVLCEVISWSPNQLVAELRWTRWVEPRQTRSHQ
jgi:hypothetical protein